jgi:DNA helicase-2/ATP-dependent DNA helicase PcrA
MNLPSRFIDEAGIKSSPAPLKNNVFQTEAQHEPDYDFNQDPTSAPAAIGARPRSWKLNQRVQHPDFGDGKVVEVEGSGEHAKVTVFFFASGAKKKLLVKYAPLQPL